MGWKSKPPPAPPVPDYVNLAKEQAKLDQEAVDRQTLANRSDQYTPEGSLKWTQDPATGRWTQTITESEDIQKARADAGEIRTGLTETAKGLLGGAQEAVKDPFSYEGMSEVESYNPLATPGTEGLPEMRGIDESKLGAYKDLDYSGAEELGDTGFGAVEGIREAMMSRLSPQLQQARERERNRLKAQGFTEGSQGLMRAQTQADQRENDAEQQALLGAAGEYGNIFERKLQARKQGVSEADKQAAFAAGLREQQLSEQDLLSTRQNQLRGQGLDERFRLTDAENRRMADVRTASGQDRDRQIKEALALRQMPLNELNAFMSGNQIDSPEFSDYKGAGLAEGADIYGANKDKYKAEIDVINAIRARNAGKIGGILGLAGAAVGGYFGGGEGMTKGGEMGYKVGSGIGS